QKTILSLPPSDPPHAHPPGNGKGGPARPRQTKRQPLSARPERDVSYSCILSFARTSMRYRFPNKSSTSMRTDISDGLCLTDANARTRGFVPFYESFIFRRFLVILAFHDDPSPVIVLLPERIASNCIWPTAQFLRGTPTLPAPWGTICRGCECYPFADGRASGACGPKT